MSERTFTNERSQDASCMMEIRENVCICVCVCERGREREKGEKPDSVGGSPHKTGVHPGCIPAKKGSETPQSKATFGNKQRLQMRC
jgi:hypothetical protein